MTPIAPPVYPCDLVKLSLEQLVKLMGVQNAVTLRALAAEAALAEARECVANGDMAGAAAGFEAASASLGKLSQELEGLSLEALATATPRLGQTDKDHPWALAEAAAAS